MAIDFFEIDAEYRFSLDEFDEDPFTFTVTDIRNDVYGGDARIDGIDECGESGCMAIDDEWHRDRCTLISSPNPAMYQPEDWS